MPTETLPSNPLLTGDTLTPVTTSAGMLFACWAMVIVPFIHIISGVIARFLDPSLPLTGMEIRAIIDTTAALISCLLVGAMSRGIPQRRTRNMLSVGCSAFVIILTLVLLINTLSMR